MAPFDPYSDAATEADAHELLVSHLPLASTDATINIHKDDDVVVMKLPNEVLELVFTQLPTKHDIAQVCKVSRRFFATGTRVLYRDMHFVIENGLDPKLAQLFSSTNTTGLQSVRNIVITLKRSQDRGGNLDQAEQWLMMLFCQLLLRQLHSCVLDPPHRVSPRLLQTLWQRQRNLKKLQIAPTTRAGETNGSDAIDLLATLNSIEFTDLTSLQLVASSVRTAGRGCAVMQRGLIKHLEVDARFWVEPTRISLDWGGGAASAASDDEGDDVDDVDDDDGTGEEEESKKDHLTSALFSHLPNAQPGVPAIYDKLSSLKLKDVDITLCKHTWFAYLELSQLKHLRLEHCIGADIFLLKLSLSPATPGLHTLSLLHTATSGEDRSIHAIEDLVRYPRHTLRKLELSIRNAPRLPDAEIFKQHSLTLRTLMLDIMGIKDAGLNPNTGMCEPAHLVYGYSEIRAIAQHCKALRELGIALNRPTLAYVNFRAENSHFAELIEVLATSLRLKVLNLYNWPISGHAGPGEARLFAMLTPAIGRIAAEIFGMHRLYHAKPQVADESAVSANDDQSASDLRHGDGMPSGSSLQIIAFGIRTKERNNQPPVYFMQSEVALLGSSKKKLHAEEVDMKHIESEGLGSALLTYDERDFDPQSRKTILQPQAPARRASGVSEAMAHDAWAAAAHALAWQ